MAAQSASDAVNRDPPRTFAFLALRFSQNQPTVLISSKVFLLVPFSSNLAPVFLSNSARSPRTCYSTVLFKFKFVLFTEMPLEPYFMHNFYVLSLIRVILSLMCS